jgi:large repetitive protein
MISSKKRLYLLIFFIIPITTALMFPFASGAATGGQKQTQSKGAAVRERPNYDAFGDRGKRSEAASMQSSVQNQEQPQYEGGHLIQSEPRLGVPTFLWASLSDQGSAMSLRAVSGQAGPKSGGFESIARDHLSKYASRYRLSVEDIANAKLTSVHDTRQGPIIVKFKREVGGIEVFHDEVAIIMNRDLQLIAISGYITGGDDGATPAFSLQSTAAITKALTDLTGNTIDQSSLKRATKTGAAANEDSYQYFTAGKDQTPGFVLGDLVRSRQVMYHLVDQYIPSYYIEINVLIPMPDSSSVDLSGNPQIEWVTEAYSYVISAADGQILFRKNLSQNDAYTYRVFADPTTKIPYDSPAGNAVVPKIFASPDGVQYPFLSQNDITLQNYPFSRNDPWLPPGATETVGNNVDAYVDLINPDGLNPSGPPADPATADFRAQITSAGEFLHTHTPDADPKISEARQGMIQQLFYDVNFLHDWYYEAGFNEGSGNAQASNYGRGGAENDRLRAEGQDVSSRNTSNMLTPADGTSPRMQMFLFDANAIKFVDVLTPAAAAGRRVVGTAQFGAQTFDVTNEVVQPNPASGCTAGSYTGTAGKFVLVDRDPSATCTIGTKVNAAMAAGAAGFIFVNLASTPNDTVNVTGSLPSFTIPFLSISWNSALSIKTERAVPNTVTARMRRDVSPDRDGGVDNQGVFHEWGHYLSNRLVGNSAGLVSTQAQGMGEGWGDFNALLLSVRPDDAAVASNPNFDGTYALSTYVSSGGDNNGYYYGNRRYPYSTDMTKNPLTLKHIRTGETLPVGPPRNPSQAISTNNSEVHNTGEVWAEMLWECYASLLRDTQGASPRLSFQEAQTRMKYYLVAALKTTPTAPTFLEGRDALLAAAYATDPVDYQRFWAAFSKRGAGMGATIADRFTLDNSGVTESFSLVSDASFTGATLDDLALSCDQDGILDTGETGHLVLNLRNDSLNTLAATTGTVTSTTPGITLSNGGNVTFGAISPSSSASASIDVPFATGVAGVQSLDFQFTYNDPQFATPHTVSFSIRGNTNSIPASTATDTAETGNHGWTVLSIPPTVITSGVTQVVGVASPFRIKEVSALQHVWHVDDLGTYTEERLTSPFFTVDGSGSFNMQFDHSWNFEFDGGGNYDGGVVELSVNGGAYTDFFSPGYNGTILNQGAGSPNPLRGRSGFVNNSAGTIHASMTQAIAPGSTVQIRFREGSDGAIGAAGWNIDNIAFSGVVETPFSTLVADFGSCPAPSPTPVVLQLSPSSMPVGTLNTVYPTTVLIASGGSGSYSYSFTPFGLPPGLVRDDVGGNPQISGTPTQSGTYPLTIVVNDGAGHKRTFNYSITINRLDPNVAWSNPADITFGTALSATQLNATAGVAGSFTYTPTAGTVLNAGNSQTLSVHFVPTDTNYSSITKTVTINVLKATPSITWSNPADITYGTALSGTQLNASASVPGVLTYSPPSGTVLIAGNAQQLSVNFVPTDTTNYNNTSTNVLINVSKATPAITWSNPADIAYGTALSATQLNASASVPGSFTYTPPATTVPAGGNAQTLSVTFVPTDTANYNNNSKDVLINVTKVNQTINFGALSAKTFGDPDFTVSATASSSLMVDFAATGNCTVSGTTVHLTGTGSCTVTASQAGDSNHSAATTVPQTFAVSKNNQTITFAVLSAKSYGDADFNVSAIASSNLTVTFAAAGNCTVSSGTVHLTGAGSCTITASQVGSDNYNAAPNVAQGFGVDRGNQSITFGTLPARTFGDGNFNLSASASSTLTVTFSANGSCTVSGNTVHLTGTGSCTITASQGGDSNYNAAANEGQTFAVSKANQTITFGALPAKTVGAVDFNVGATSSSNLTVSFAATGTCTISGNSVHLTGAGSCTITASQGGDSNYNAAANVGQTFAVDKANQTITFAALSTKTFGAADFSVGATASSNLTVSFVATGSCTVGSNTVHITGAGSCTITASQSGDGNYNPAANVGQTFAVDKTSQTITFAALSTKTFGAADFSVGATASSNLTVSFVATGTCTVGGNTVHLTGAGACTITASQSGDSNYNPAANVGQTFAVDKANQTITFAALPAKTFNDANFNVSATASSNLTVSFGAAGNCTVSGNTVHLSGVGSCTITASQGGDDNHNAAASVGQTFAVGKADQTITFGALPAKTFGDADFNVDGTASSNLAISFASTGNCTVSGNTVHLTAVGACTITASQGGDTTYNAAATVSQTFAVNKANQTIVFNTLAPKKFGDTDFNVSATASSNLTVSFASTGNCTVSGNTVHLTAVGSCTITASQPGDSNYNAATSVLRSFSIDKANQTIMFAALATKTFGDADFTVSATATSSLQVNFTASGSCAVSGNTVHINSAGACTITASQSGNTNFNPAPDVPQGFNIIAVPDTPSVTNATTNAHTQTTSGLVISRNPPDGAQVTHFRITGITGGALFKNNGTTPINNGDFITFAEGNAGLKFTPGTTNGSFNVQASTSASNAGLGGGVVTAMIIINPLGGVIRFSAADYNVAEGAGSKTITVERMGDTSKPATVDYASSDNSNSADFIPCSSPGAGFASSRCDYTTATGTLRFAAGETSKTFDVLISQDNYVEGNETVELTLSNPTGGAEFGEPSTAILSITDDAVEPATNPIDISSDFVRSQYHDLLNREPDAPGLAFWVDNIEKCNDASRRPPGQTATQCLDKQREATAIAFFVSPEFQMTSGFVFRLYKGSLSGVPNYDGGSVGRFPTALEFSRDLSQVAEGILVNDQISGSVVEANRNRLAAEFVQRPEFVTRYGRLSHTLYVQELFNTTGGSPTNSEKQMLVDGLTNGTETRASVLRKVVDGTVVTNEANVQFATAYGQEFYEQERRRVFVYMEYVGYLRRNPDTAGFIHWLGKLNEFSGDSFKAEMVRAFILSPEYRSRFGQN